jgi:glycosyltransferase involved in cell wall biosynthesis
MAKFYAFCFFPFCKKIFNLVKQADVVHSTTSDMTTIPIFLAPLCGVFLKKPTVVSSDIDFRKSALMSFQSGKITRKSYLLRRYIYDKLLSLQIVFLVKTGCLTLLKGRLMCEDYGRGMDNVKNHLDSAYSKEQIISPADLENKVIKAGNGHNALEVVYFGRLVPYKALDLCIQALWYAQQKTTRKINFHIFGSGEQEPFLKKLVQEKNMTNNVIFHGDFPYGKKLFAQLYPCHLLLATPLREDTPRSALDALAAGIPILAFDTYYYKELEETGAVVTVPWPSVEKMGDKIAEINNSRKLLADMMSKAVAFARENTQEIWLERRFQWTKELMKKKDPEKFKEALKT